MAGNSDMAQQNASHLHDPNVSVRLSSSNVTFKVHKKLLEYDLPSKVRSDLVSRKEVSGLIQESENESREYDREMERLKTEIKRWETEIQRLESVILALKKRPEGAKKFYE